MAHPYAQLRAQMSPDAQAEAEAQAQALLAALPHQDDHAQMTRLHAAVSAMADALEAAAPLPGGGHLQATMDTAWNALISLALGIEDWLARQENTP